MNIESLINCPYGQFVSALWRGSEKRETLNVHVGSHYDDLSNAVKSGMNLIVNDQPETFNLICFLIADLSFSKKYKVNVHVRHSMVATIVRINAMNGQKDAE